VELATLSTTQFAYVTREREATRSEAQARDRLAAVIQYKTTLALIGIARTSPAPQLQLRRIAITHLIHPSSHHTTTLEGHTTLVALSKAT